MKILKTILAGISLFFNYSALAMQYEANLYKINSKKY